MKAVCQLFTKDMINQNCNLTLLVVASLFVTACVTINIYFPAAAAERVVDKIIDEVWQADDNIGSKEQKKSGNNIHKDDGTDNKSD